MFHILNKMEGKKNFSKVFLIAGSEPLGSAGIQADIKAISACGGFAAGSITCIVNEDTLKVKDICTIPVDLVIGQADSFLGDVGADCIKTGMLYSAELIEAVAGLLKKYSTVPLLVDPVMVSSGGDQLIKNDAVEVYKNHLFPMAKIITPNFREAEILLGRKINKDNIIEDLKELAQWGNSVIVKSVPGDGILTDYYYDAIEKQMTSFPKKKIETKNVNGTGDTFGSAIATYIARGYDCLDAVTKAEIFIQQSIKNGAEFSFGQGFGPVHPFYRMRTFFEEENMQYHLSKNIPD